MESIVKDLESLPAPKLVEVAHYVSRLNPRRREERLAALKATAGCLSGEEGAAFEKAVREEGQRVDLNDWTMKPPGYTEKSLHSWRGVERLFHKMTSGLRR